MLAPPVVRGVVRFEGISEVIVLVVGETMNFCEMTPSNDCVKPVELQFVNPNDQTTATQTLLLTFDFTAIANHN